MGLLLGSSAIAADTTGPGSVATSDSRSESPPKFLPIRVRAAENIRYAEEPDAAQPSGPKGTRVELLPSPTPGQTANVKLPPIDPQIKPLNALTTQIAPPLEVDRQGNTLPFPDDLATQYFSQTALNARFPGAHEAWHGDVEYALDFDFCYRPLYFEEVRAERYGYAYGLFQPVVSAARFYGTVPLMPLKTWIEPPCWCTLHPGRDLPGYPPLRTRPPWHAVNAVRAVSAACFDAKCPSEVPNEPLTE